MTSPLGLLLPNRRHLCARPASPPLRPARGPRQVRGAAGRARGVRGFGRSRAISAPAAKGVRSRPWLAGILFPSPNTPLLTFLSPWPFLVRFSKSVLSRCTAGLISGGAVARGAQVGQSTTPREPSLRPSQVTFPLPESPQPSKKQSFYFSILNLSSPNYRT